MSAKINNVTSSKFCIDNLQIPREIKVGPKTDEFQQYMAFVKYDYKSTVNNETGKAEPKMDTLRIVTKEFNIKKSKLLAIDSQYRPTDDKCGAFWLSLEEKHDGIGAADLHNVFSKIDKKTMSDMERTKDKFLVLKCDKKDDVLLDSLDYVSLARESETGGRPDVVQWLRTKVKIPLKKKSDGKEIDMTLAFLDKTNPQNNRELSVSTVTELRTYFRSGCKAKFVLELQSFWAAKGKTNKRRPCGYKVICKMIMITELSSQSEKNNVLPSWNNLMADDEDEDEDKDSGAMLPTGDNVQSQNDNCDESQKNKADDNDSNSDASESPKIEPSKKPAKESVKKITIKKPGNKVSKKAKQDSSESEQSD